MKVFVTGAAGFLGSHLCERMLADGCEVTGVDNFYTGSPLNIAGFAGNPGFKFVEGDVCELSPSDFGRFDVVCNLACPASPVHYQARPVFTSMTALKGVLLCLELAKRDGAKMLHASTSEIYGDPAVHPQTESYWGNVNTIGIRSCYDEGKRMGETFVADYVRLYDVDARMVRIFNTYGPRMHPQDGRVVSNFIMQALSGRDITVYGDGSQTRSFQYCDDLIEAFVRYISESKERMRGFFGVPGRPPVPVINAGNPGEYTIAELAEKTLAMFPSSASRIVYRDLPGDDPKKRKPDISLATELLQWTPQVPLDTGLRRTAEYFKSLPCVEPGKTEIK